MATFTLIGTATFANAAPNPFAGILLTVPAALLLSGQSNWDGLSTNTPPAHVFPNIVIALATAQPVIDVAYGRIYLLRVELVN